MNGTDSEVLTSARRLRLHVLVRLDSDVSGLRACDSLRVWDEQRVWGRRSLRESPRNPQMFGSESPSMDRMAKYGPAHAPMRIILHNTYIWRP